MAVSKILELPDTSSVCTEHLNHYLQHRQWSVECQVLNERNASDISQWLPFLEAEALALRFPAEISPVILSQFPRLPTAVNWLATADLLVLEGGEWWPRLLSYEALKKLLIHQYPEMDTSGCAYIVGATHKGRAAAAAMAALGFSQIRFIDENQDRIVSELALLKRYLFGVEITGVDPTTLTMETIPGSLMLNTLPLQDHSTVMKDLSYFNFMKHGSAVIDMSSCTEHNAFLDEAESASLKILTGVQYQSQWDVELLHKLFPEKYVTFDDYFESFSELILRSKNQPSV